MDGLLTFVSLGLMLLGVLGATLFTIGFLGRRIGDTPFCRGCGYNLTGGLGRICPECGRDVSRPKAIRRGEWRRRRKSLYIGAVLLVTVASSFGGYFFARYRGLDIQRDSPTWLLRLALWLDSEGADRTFYELESRRETGAMSASQQHGFAEQLLAAAQIGHMNTARAEGWFTLEQQLRLVHRVANELPNGIQYPPALLVLTHPELLNRVPDADLVPFIDRALRSLRIRSPHSPFHLDDAIEVLSACHIGGRFSPEQRDQFFRFLWNATTLRADTPKRVTLNSPFVVTVTASVYKLCGTIHVEHVVTKVDGQVVASGGDICETSQQCSQTFSPLQLPPVSVVGKHTLDITLRGTFTFEYEPPGAGSAPITCDFEFRSDFEVFAE